MATFVTFNMHGFNNGNVLAKQLCSNASVVCLQEQWLNGDQLVQSSNISSDFDVYAHSAISSRPNVATLFRGRPYGGLAILVKRCLFRVDYLGCSLDTRKQMLL